MTKISGKNIEIKKLGISSLVPGLTIGLPSSKSIHNRAVIISSLAGGSTEILNPSNARDSELMNTLIDRNEEVVDAKDAGTTFRFLTAYYAIRNEPRILTGTARMKERPIALLVDALRELGASIDYMGKEGYPPLRIGSYQPGSSAVSIPGNVSSQYISALLMIGPCLPEGLTVEITGQIGSRPYINMTLSVMKEFGARFNWDGQVIKILPNVYVAPASFWVEPDWSAASYWYSFLALAGSGALSIPGLKRESTQGDSIVAEIMLELGIHTEFTKEGIKLTATGKLGQVDRDFTDCPDLAQTVAVACAALGVKCRMTGLESLRIKETDRISALQKELSKFGCRLEDNGNSWQVAGSFSAASSPTLIETYEDHRMAMAFAPLSMLCPIDIEDPSVTRKSYPHFWEDISMATTF